MRTRVISAVVVLLVFLAAYFGFGNNGLFWCGFVASLGCGWEYTRLTVNNKLSQGLRWLILFLIWSVLAVTIWSYGWAILVVAVYSVVLLSTTILSIHTSEDLPKTLNIQSLGLTGLLHCGVFPGLAMRLLQEPDGDKWLFSLLGIVFFGDSFAYLVGRKFGKTKIFPEVSPKKTIEGAAGGLAGSLLAGAIAHSLWLSHVPLLNFLVMALVSGVFAQIGDFFESLIKRVADVKDSGAIMPGHGGILDRLDGVLFAAPIFYLFLHIITNRAL